MDEKLNHMTDVQRQTVELINRLAEDEGLNYADLTLERIKQARFDAGMSKGSNTDVMKLKNKWAEIYGIDPNSVRVATEVKERLVKRVMQSMDDELRQLYENKLDKVTQKSEETKKLLQQEVTQTQIELNNTKTVLASEQQLVTELKPQIEELLLEKDTLLEQKRELDKEGTSLRVSVGSLEKRVVDKDKQVAVLNKNFDVLRSDMESQRQAQLAVIDEHRTEAKRANKLVNELRGKISHLEQQLNDSKQQTMAEKGLNKSLKAEFSMQEKALHQQLKSNNKVVVELRKESQLQNDKIAKLESSLDSERQSHNKQSEALFARFEKMIADNQKSGISCKSHYLI